ncbi:ABC transporter substrate-binding protein [Candidatus Thiothrix sp. Deng01]|uniref:histidine kinase n=1 Tax=Candidatus Thiothrix phosphatis TaxID=3112415 RepID=A0ABU6CY36_9GAMM|nr:ABC transporter substrate-binding protein [Candidatus Thiothrix sp. Deng01]MEB4591437.1 ABC transporter substrate-binding protein [Candidatus Thiothrix sp. Deng01]
MLNRCSGTLVRYGRVWVILLGVFMHHPALAAQQPLDQVVLQLKWVPQFQFAGYYAAQAKGFFREEGLEVTLQPGGPEVAPMVEVLDGRAQYGVEAGELVYHRLQGKPVVAVASIFQHSPAALMTMGNSNLLTPHDLAHKRVGMLVGGQPIVEIAAMFVNEGVKLDALSLQPNSIGTDALVSGKLDADFAYMTNDPFKNKLAGRDVHYLLPINYGVDFYGDTLFTTERQLQEHPEQVAALYRAVVRGWRYALENPEETISLMLERFPNLQRDALRFEAGRIRELVNPDIVQIGHMNSERWRRMADTFVKLEMVNDTSRLAGFLYDPEQRPDYRWLWWVLGVLGGAILLGFAGSGVLAWFNGRLQAQNSLLQQSMQERRQAENLLQESRRTLQSLIGNLPGMAYRCRYNRQWAMEFISDGCEILIGYPASHFLGVQGHSFNSLIHPDDQDQVWDEVSAAVADGHAYQLNYRVRHRNGTWRWVWEQGHCVERDMQGVPLFLEGLIMDITPQVDTRQKLQQAKEKADAATRAKSIFLANISHEIRTPLTAVTGLAELLQQMELGSKQREYAEQLFASSRLLLGIVEDVMDFSRIEAGEASLRPAPFHLPGILQSVEYVVGEQAHAKGLGFQVVAQKNIPPFLVGDPLRLSQVLNNLLVNAIKFTTKGEVSLHVSMESRTHTQVRLLFCVRDTGIGIPASQRSRLFEPFTRIEGQSDAIAIKGAGLGLSISRRLVELMGGEIRVESIPGVGSEFSFAANFEVETRTQARVEASVPLEDAGSGALAGAKVLLVDDEPLNLMIGVEILHKFACNVQTADTAVQALKRLEHEPFDLVLLDVEMPGMKGDELARRIRQNARWRDLPLVALTAHASTDIRERCRESGMDAYLAKPFEIKQLRQVLLRFLAARQSA